MRRYPLNSSQAAARVVALTLLADGTVSRGELSALARVGLFDRLGLDSKAMQALLEDLARDLYEFGTPVWDHAGGLHPLVVRCVLEDVTDPALRHEVLEMCRAVAESDSHVSHGEEALLQLASAQWCLSRSTHLHTLQKGTS